jgi:hypothetical protein
LSKANRNLKNYPPPRDGADEPNLILGTETVDWSAAENSNNPADSAGYIHNLALWDVRNISDLQEAYDGIIKFFTNRWGSSFDDNQFRNTFTIVVIERIIEDSASLWDDTIDNTSFSVNAKDALKTLTRNFLLDTASLSTDFSYNEIRNSIIIWENNLSESGAISQSEKELLLHVSSVARFSSLYWYNQFNEVWENMSPEERQAVGKKRKWWQWLIVAACDVGGAIFGAQVNPGVAVTAASAASGTAAAIINWGTG